MKKKKKLSILLALSITAMVSVVSGIALSVSANTEDDWSDITVNGEYDYKSTFEIEDRTYTKGAKTYTASSLLCYPDGTVSEDKQALLDQVGIYTLKYSVSAGDKVHAESEKFLVNYPRYDVGSSKSSLSYGIPDRATTKGVIAELAQNDSLVFTQYIDFTKISNMDNLIKGFVVPSVVGANDFSELVFTFTDSVDSSVNFKVHFYGYDWTYNTYAAVHGQNQDPVGVHQSQGAHTSDGYGLWSYVTFKSVGQKSTVAPDETQFFISMNYAEKKVYTVGFPGQKNEIADMDDTSLFKSVWTGFPSGKARLSVEAQNYSGSSATVCITEVYGIDDLSDNVFIDSDKPEITVNDEYGGDMPSALKGYSYEIPSASAYDAYAGDCDVKVSVLYNYGTDSSVNVPVKNGRFVTDKVGTYGILYEACDKVGNCSSKVLYVFAYEKLPEVAFEIPPQAVTNAKSGEWVNIITVSGDSISGGSGKKTVRTYLEFNGERELVSGGFRAMETGVYTVIYEVTDYVGKKSEKSYNVVVAENDVPVLEKDYNIFPAYISGGEYTIPEYSAYVTKNGKLTKELCDVSITDGNGTKQYKAGDKATISVGNNGDSVRFTVSSNGTTLVSHESVGVAAWVRNEAGTRFHLENYLVGNGFATEKTANGMVLTAQGESMKFVFANALSSKQVTTRVSAIKGANENTVLRIKLFDAIDETVGFSIVVGGVSVPYAEIEGVKYTLKDTTFDENGTIEIAYSENTVTVNGTSVLLTSFDGFERNEVFLEIAYEEYGENAGITFAGVGNCNFNTAQTDRFAPVIEATHETGGVRTFGEEYVLYAPVAYDVYAPNLEYYLTVTAPDGLPAKDVNGLILDKVDPTIDYVIRLDKIGEYKVEYFIAEAKSFVSRQNNSSLKYTIVIADEDAPELVWKGEFPTELIVGDMFIVPKYEVSDNYSAAENIIVRVFVETPASQLIMLPGNALKMTHEGEYEIRIMVVDEAGNIANYVKHISVKRA